MFLARTYTSRKDIPRGAEALYTPTGNLFILTGAKRDFVADNPWEIDNWNLTEQGRFITQYGAALAAAFAKIAGTRVGGPRPVIVDIRPKLQVLIQRRDLIVAGTGTAEGGISGDGPPTG